jgi:hypothetical protein
MTKRFWETNGITVCQAVLMGGLVLTLGLFLGGCKNPTGGDDSPSAQQLAAEEFRAVWGLVLEIQPERVSLSDEADVDDTLEAWEALSDEVKAELATEKAVLDTLKANINTLKSSTAVLRSYLEGKPDNTVYNPYPVVYTGRETPAAIYSTLAAAGKYVSLDLSASSVTGFEYDVEEGRKFVVELTLPDSLEEIEDQAAAEPAFGGFPNLKSLRAPNMVTVGQYAFYGCTSLETVSLDNAVNIGQYAFYGCTSLEAITLDNAETIGNYAFRGCTGLKTAALNKAVDIGFQMFYGCTSLETVSLDAATSIGQQAFYQCASLETVNLEAVESVGTSAFSQCVSLNAVNLPNAVSIGVTAFQHCVAFTTITLPKAASIGNQAFYGCSNVTTITLPKVETIGNSVFTSCEGLTTVILGETPPAIGTRIFTAAAKETRTITIKVPNVNAYTTTGSPWSDKMGLNSSAGYFWDNDTNIPTRDNLTVNLAAIDG